MKNEVSFPDKLHVLYEVTENLVLGQAFGLTPRRHLGCPHATQEQLGLSLSFAPDSGCTMQSSMQCFVLLGLCHPHGNHLGPTFLVPGISLASSAIVAISGVNRKWEISPSSSLLPTLK